MNYFAHGRQFVNQPYFMAGTSVPDWLPVLNRRVKALPSGARPFLEDKDPELSAMAAGILQHHHDDSWFHLSETFITLSMACTGHWRKLLGTQSGLRSRFLGHVLVELLLDAELIRREPGLLDEYYQVMESLDGERVEKLVSTMTTKPASGLAQLLVGFCRERFLYDYLQDATLLRRLNQVMKRVGLEQIPAAAASLVSTMRPLVSDQADQLLAEPAEQTIKR